MSEQAKWTVIGPGGGGAQYFPTISPHDPNCVLVGCDMTGAYITHDGGASWRMFNLRGRAMAFTFDPGDANVIYVQDNGLWRSEDSGKTWGILYPDPATVTGVACVGDHGETRLLTTGPTPATVTAFAVDPADSKTLYAVMRQGTDSSLQISPDGGKTWNKAADLPDGGRRLFLDAHSSRQDRTLYVVGNHAVTVREGGQWKQGATPAEGNGLIDASLGFAGAGGKPTVYAIARSGLFVSADGGATWKAAALPGESPRYMAVATSLHHPNVAYVSYHRLQVGDKEYSGVAKTVDGGATWELVWKETEEAAPNIKDAWITDRFGPGWGENPLCLGVAPDNPNLCYGTDLGRTMRTTDGGKTWHAVYAKRLADGSYTTTGLDVTTAHGIQFDPFDPKRVFIDYTDIGLFRSEDGGHGWTSATAGVPRQWVNTTYWLAFDPEVRGRIWGVMSGTHDLPRPKMWRRGGFARYHGGVCRSDDGGKTWKPCNAGMPETAATHILLDPKSPKEKRVLYVTGFGTGVYKSTDGGENWTLKNTGLPETEPTAWRLTMDSQGVLYLILARRSEDGATDEGAGALYRSTDGAEHWTKRTLPADVNGPNGLAIDPNDPNRLYLAAWSRVLDDKAVDGGIYLSTDGGTTWKNVLSEDQHVFDVTIDPKNPNVLYACGFSSSAWRSTDHGESWQRIRGYNFKWGQRVFPDPVDPSQIYVTTFGGSVWHGPAAGDPNAAEDIITPALRYTR